MEQREQRHSIVTILGDEDSNTSNDAKSVGPRDTGWDGESGKLTSDNVASNFISTPPPPAKLWDTDDIQYLSKVKCKVSIMLTHIDPKNGLFEGRMKFHWNMRTLNYQERTEPLLRVPGIRFPRLSCRIEESRMWRNFDHDSDITVAWQGTTVLSFSGHEMFEVHDFPYDRQVIDLNLFEFVWRDDKDTDRFYEEMKVVSFSTETQSMMPEWDACNAITEPRNVEQRHTGPTFCSRFLVKLRFQRRERYYVTQIFMVTYLITSAASFTLALSPGKRFVGDRLTVLTSGLLTLVSFKYSISHDLPSVPYPTFASTYLAAQVHTLVAIAAETVITYKMAIDGVVEEKILALFEDCLLIFLLLIWAAYFLYARHGKKRRPWEDVLNSQNDSAEIKDSPPEKAATFMLSENTESAKFQYHPKHAATYIRLVSILKAVGGKLCDSKAKEKMQEDDFKDTKDLPDTKFYYRKAREQLPKTLAL